MRKAPFALTRVPLLTRTFSCTLAVTIALGVSLAAQRDIALSQANQETLAALMKEAKNWVEEEMRLSIDLSNRAKHTTENARKALQRQDSALLQAYEDHRKALSSAIESLGFVRALTDTLVGLRRNGMPGMISLRLDRAGQASSIDRYRKAARNDLDFARRAVPPASAAPEREIRAASVVAYEESLRYIDRWEQRYDAYLVAAGAQPVAEFLTRQAERLHLMRENAERQRIENAHRRELLGAAVLMVVAAPVVVALLQSGTSTPEDEARARKQLAEMKATQSFLCGIRGGSFLDGGPFAVGVCTK